MTQLSPSPSLPLLPRIHFSVVFFFRSPSTIKCLAQEVSTTPNPLFIALLSPPPSLPSPSPLAHRSFASPSPLPPSPGPAQHSVALLPPSLPHTPSAMSWNYFFVSIPSPFSSRLPSWIGPREKLLYVSNYTFFL